VKSHLETSVDATITHSDSDSAQNALKPLIPLFTLFSFYCTSRTLCSSNRRFNQLSPIWSALQRPSRPPHNHAPWFPLCSDVGLRYNNIFSPFLAISVHINFLPCLCFSAKLMIKSSVLFLVRVFDNHWSKMRSFTWK